MPSVLFKDSHSYIDPVKCNLPGPTISIYFRPKLAKMSWKKLTELSINDSEHLISTMDPSIINNKLWDACVKYSCDLNKILRGSGKEKRRGEVGCVLALISNFNNYMKFRLVMPSQPPSKPLPVTHVSWCHFLPAWPVIWEVAKFLILYICIDAYTSTKHHRN